MPLGYAILLIGIRRVCRHRCMILITSVSSSTLLSSQSLPLPLAHLLIFLPCPIMQQIECCIFTRSRQHLQRLQSPFSPPSRRDRRSQSSTQGHRVVLNTVIHSPSTRKHQNIAGARPLRASPATHVETLARSATPSRFESPLSDLDPVV
jgi:hypothetical protein